ncbi:hypothetical protein BDV29DRAFT_125635 [Aspergillus leporis]|uniref:Bul1 C-terminal domain-containing protein n=1 Tax=Aspergillus leporis TaxID=41062 RepID=A0A5N5X2A7_9EURO|nr:hypothetical protein BDV29DRAFT_125635 [Aspergillus leporis]
MEIRLNNKQTIFTTGDTITGDLIFHRKTSRQHADISVALIGRTTTTVTKSMPYPNNGTTIDYPFLQMHHTETLPLSQCNQTTFPCTFVVPSLLPLDPCTKHLPGTAHHQNQTHLQLPPSINYNLDKFCPKMCSVIYYLHAEVNIGSERLYAKRGIQLLPLYSEGPPRLWTEEIQGSETTSLRAGLWGTKIGRITLCAGQSKALCLPEFGRQQKQKPTMTPMRLDLRLESFDSRTARLPAECQVRVTLEAVTYYTTLPMGELPSLQNVVERQGQACRAVVCSWKNKSVGLQWSRWDGGDGSYEASIVVPVPGGGGDIVPTFYHCYVAREYFAKVEVVVGSSRTLRVKVPVQIYNSVES